jgi:hypothetical protein
MGMDEAQRQYDNQVPEDRYPDHPTDEQYEEYLQTEAHGDWMMENAGNGDWVTYEENNFDLLLEMCREWLEDNAPEPPEYHKGEE